MSPRAILMLLIAASGCSASDGPDARQLPMVTPDAAAGADDARPADARASDAAPGAADARTLDAPISLDATIVPDAAVPDAAETPDATPPPAAELLINEVNANLAPKDLVELLVTQGGTTSGWRLEGNYRTSPALLAELPDVVVATGDLIVVHLTPGDLEGETTGPSQHSSPEHFDGAWDFLGVDQSIGHDNRLLALRAPGGDLDSVVPFFRPDISNPPRTFYPADLQAAIDAGLWDETCDPSPCTYSSNLDQVTVSWAGLGDDPAGASVSRKPDGVNDMQASDWQAVPDTAPFNSFGSPN